MSDLRAQPAWVDGLPLCDGDACMAYDGKRCQLLGRRPTTHCEPALTTLREDHDRLSTAVIAFLDAHDSGQSVREAIAAMREAVSE